ncbi:hypothetical protein PC119_g14853 [Phytophthora cactorum]|nr:hypothetical protein PC112_g13876 [Phytophthora cactorum]KAG3006794.1 hypothetical protein PC119_g14853 [Phytophthora cactorum]KAG3190257.1 hypothetical protein PC128_g11415 [Phytophthora cactorum]
MSTLATKTAIVLLLVLLHESMANAKMYVYFNDRRKLFSFEHTQRYYTISTCWDDLSRNSAWNNLPHASQMVWFKDQHCQGLSISQSGPKGFINFKGTKLYNTVSSFMAMEYSMYPLQGMMDKCHESAVLNGSTFEFVDDVKGNKH